MKKIILLSVLVATSIVALSQIAYAANSTLSISPASLDRTVGTLFNVSVSIDPAGNKVCVVKGTLSLDNLSCRSISVASGFYAIVTPTCAKPSFILGIPKCTTTAQNVLTLSIRGSNAGQAKASLTGTNVIGAGTAVAFVANGGIYNITAGPTPTPAPEVIIPQNVEQQSTEQITTPIQPATPENNIPANVGVAGLAEAGVGWANLLWVLLGLAIIGGVVYLIYRLKGKKK